MRKLHTRFKFTGATKYGKRHKPGEMNATEAAFADELQLRKLAGEIVDWQFEALTFVLAKDCRYTPDFMALHLDGSLELIDVKGSAFAVDPKSTVKIRIAAEKFWMFEWVQVIRKTKRDGGGWTCKGFNT